MLLEIDHMAFMCLPLIIYEWLAETCMNEICMYMHVRVK